MVSRKTLSASALGMAGLALAACDHGVNAPMALTGSGTFIGDYTVVGDRIIMQQPPDTTWSCDAGQLVMEVEPSEPDTTPYTLVGGALTIWSEPDTMFDVTGVTAVIQTGTVLRRVGSGNGLEGRWQTIGTNSP